MASVSDQLFVDSEGYAHGVRPGPGDRDHPGRQPYEDSGLNHHILCLQEPGCAI